MGSLFSYLTSHEGSLINPQNQNENFHQNNSELQSIKNESQIQMVQDSISNIGASYFAAAKKTFLGENNQQKSQEPIQDKKVDQQIEINKDQFSSRNPNIEIPQNPQIDQNAVLQCLIEQNKSLKTQIIKQNIEFKKSLKSNQIPQQGIETTPALNEILRQSSIQSQNLQDFDPQKEFREIQKLYKENKISPSQQDISYLYSSCFYSKDLLIIQNLKIKIYQAIAERAIRNQELLFKSTKRRGLQLNDINPIHIYIENNQMKQTIQGLRGQLEQLYQTLQNKIDMQNHNEKVFKDKIFSLGTSLQNQKQIISNLKKKWLKLKNESNQFNLQIQDPKIFEGIKSLIHNSASRYDKEIEAFRKSILQKNKEIGDLFMKNKKQEENYEQKLKDLEKSIRTEQEKDLGTIVFQKNQEIAKQYNENLQFKQKIESLQQERYEQLEILETVQQESVMLKDQLRAYQQEKKKLFDQIQNLDSDNKEIQSQAEEYQAYIDQLQSQISEKEGQLQEMQEFIQIKNDELNKMEDEIDQYQLDIDKKQKVIQQLQIRIKEMENLNNNDKLHQSKIINDLQSQIQQLEEKMKDSISQKQKNETLIHKTIPKLNLKNINKTENNVLLKKIQNEIKEQQNTNNLFAGQVSQINEEMTNADIEINKEIINEWGASMSSDIDLQQSINLQSNEIESNDVKDAAEDEFVRMKSHLDSSKLHIIISQIQKPNQESQKLDQFFSELKIQKQIQKNQINEELDKEILNDDLIESQQIQNQIDNNEKQENEIIEINEKQWGELDIQLESDRAIEKQQEESLPSKRRQKHKKQKSVRLNKSNQFQNYCNQDIQNDQENMSVKKENQMQFFKDLNEQDQNIFDNYNNNLNAINEEDSNAQGDSSARKENSKELKNSQSSKINPQINIDKSESIDKQQKNRINQKEKDNDFNSSVFPDSIHNENVKDEEQDMMIMTINSGDVNLQLLDSVQSGKNSFIQDCLQNNFQSANSPQKNVQDFILEYQENNQAIVNKDLVDLFEVEVQEINSQKKFHQKASQSFHQRNAEMINQVIIGTQVTDKMEDQEFLQKRLIEQLEQYDQQNNSLQSNLIQDLEFDNIKPPAQPDEQILTGELPEQILSDLEEDLEILQNQNSIENEVDKDLITQEQNKNQMIETIPEVEIEDDDENIQQDQISKKSLKDEKVEETKTENLIELELQDDLWGGDENKDQQINILNEVNLTDPIQNQILFEQESLIVDNHQQKSLQYQNIRKSNKQKQLEKLNIKDKLILLGKTFEATELEITQSMNEIDNREKTQTSEIQDLNRMILNDINKKEKEEEENIFNQISITQQNRALESARVLASNPLQQFQLAKNDLEDEQILQTYNQKLPHCHSNSQQFVKKNQNQPLNTIRQNKKQIPNPILKNMIEIANNSQLPSESLEEVEDSYKESEFYSPIKKKYEDQTSFVTSSEYNGLSSQKKMRRIQMMNQFEEDSLQEMGNNEGENKDNIQKVIEDVKGEDLEEDDKNLMIESHQNDEEVVFSELDAENEFTLGVSENQNTQNKIEVFDQILKGENQAQNFNYIDLNNFQINDFENEIQSIQSIASGSVTQNVQETKTEENINQLFDFVNFEKEQIKQAQKQMDSVQQNFKQQRKNLMENQEELAKFNF